LRINVQRHFLIRRKVFLRNFLSTRSSVQYPQAAFAIGGWLNRY
jgi:hypothetical protein